MEKKAAEFLREYYLLWRETNAIYEEWARKRGFSYYELMVMLSLYEEACTQKDICTKCMIHKQTVNSILKHFTEKGWVTLVEDSSDRRNKRLVITEQGAAPIEEVALALRAQECAVAKKLGEKRMKSLTEATALYNQLFQERTEE